MKRFSIESILTVVTPIAFPHPKDQTKNAIGEADKLVRYLTSNPIFDEAIFFGNCNQVAQNELIRQFPELKDLPEGEGLDYCNALVSQLRKKFGRKTLDVAPLESVLAQKVYSVLIQSK